MPTLVIAFDGRELQRLPLTQVRTTIGRRPYNDIVMEHLAVSGEHAVFVLQPDGRVQVLDLNSTNGTYVNGRAVVSAEVGPDDRIQIARYELRVVPDDVTGSAASAAGATPPLSASPAAPTAGAATGPDASAPTPVSAAPTAASAPAAPDTATPAHPAPTPESSAAAISASLEVVEGPAAGRRMTLHKPTTTLGKPGRCVAAVLQTADGHAIRQTEGGEAVLVNGVAIGTRTQPLHDGDVLTVAGTRIRYRIER